MAITSQALDFSIITPSFRNSQWLKLCIPSVNDQQGVTFEHIVQDSCSDDGTQDWLPHDKRVQAFIEKDKGMYDAVNRGWKRARGEFVAYLNCDEQYLPGALKTVAEYFRQHPDVEVVLTHTIVVDDKGNYICHRPSLVPLKNQVWVRFSALTCSVFVRRKTIEELGLYFDTRWRDLGDMFWIKDMIDRRVHMSLLPQFTSIFTETGDNMNLKPNAQRERQEKDRMMPAWVKRFEWALILHYRIRMLLSGAYFQKPFDYWLYTANSPKQRVLHRVTKPTAFWKGRK